MNKNAWKNPCINLKTFPNHCVIYKFEGKFKKYSKVIEKLRGLYKYERVCLLRLNPEGLDWWTTLCSFTMLFILTSVLRFSLKKRGQQNRAHWFWNRRLRHLLHTCVEDWRKFHSESLCCFLVTKKSNF